MTETGKVCPLLTASGRNAPPGFQDDEVWGAYVCLQARCALWFLNQCALLGIASTLASVTRVRECRVCGCTDEEGCPEGCYWVEPDLCSNCVGVEAGK